MILPRHMDPMMFGIELVYSLILFILCLWVFLKTKEIYSLTKHKGIQFFRYSFLFFGLAYASRLFLYLITVSGLDFGTPIRGGRMFSLMPISNLVVAYFSTLAILYLAYSTIWKKIDSEQFLIFSNIMALIVAVLAFIFHSPLTILIVQLILIIGATIIIFTNHHKKDKGKHATKALYLLIFAFWLLSLFVIHSRRLIPFEAKIVFQLISIAVFVGIYLKVAKWIK